MATVKLKRSNSCARSITYAEKRAVVKDGLNCNIQSANFEMAQARKIFDKNDKTQAHTIIQSFSPKESKELTPEQVNQMGIELAKKVAPHYQVAVYTHADKEHLHNHIIINSVAFETGKKYHQHNDVKRVKALNDEVVLAHGLEVTQKNPNKLEQLSDAEIQLTRRGIKPWKQAIREKIDETMKDTSICSYQAFKERLSEFGINVTDRGKNITYELLEGNNKVRGNKLGMDYEREGIKHELDRREKAHKLKPDPERYERFKERLAHGQSKNRTSGSNYRPISDRERNAAFKHQQELEKQSRLEQATQSEYESTSKRSREKNRDLGPSL